MLKKNMTFMLIYVDSKELYGGMEAQIIPGRKDKLQGGR
jgi:hypothetical protein